MFSVRFCCCCSNYDAAKLVAALSIVSIFGSVIAAGIITYFQAIGMFDAVDWVVLTWLMFMASFIATVSLIVGLVKRSRPLLYGYILAQGIQMVLSIVLLALVITGLNVLIPPGGAMAACWIAVVVIALIYLWFLAIGYGTSEEIRYYRADSYGGYHDQQRVVPVVHYNVGN